MISLEINKKNEESVRGQKNKLRIRIIQCRDALTPVERKEASCRLTDKIIQHPLYREAKVLLAFVSYGSETDTLDILMDALKSGKKVYVPKIEQTDTSGKIMVFYRMYDPAELVPGFHGIKEPSGESECYVYDEENAGSALMLMPGVAFDKKGNRMGYGGGFYDRFLENKHALRRQTIAVGFACQMVEEVPVEDNDLKPFEIITV